MKFKIFKFNRVTSTNDVAMDLIQKKEKNMDVFSQINKQEVEGHTVRYGYPKKEICLDLFFFL